MLTRRHRGFATGCLATTLLVLLLANQAAAGSKAVAVVNGVTITERDLKAAVNKKIPMASYHARVSQEKLQEIRSQALEEIIDEELLYQEARRRNLRVDPKEVDRRVERMKSAYSSDKAFRQALAESGYSYRQWTSEIRRGLLIQKLLQIEVFGKVAVTDDDVRAYYQANRRKFHLPERWKLRHILISVDPGAMAAGWEAGLKKAEKVYQRLQSGEEFSKLAKELSADSTSRSKGGDIGWIHAGQLIAELDEAVRNMKVGDISKPIRTIYGFHILKLEGVKPPKQLAFDEIDRVRLKEQLKKKKQRQRRKEFLSSLRARAKIRIFKS